MAHRETISDDLGFFLDEGPFFWAISFSVGYSCRNKKEDVQLVQYFLNKIFDGNRRDGYTSRKNITVDGQFGGETWGAIKWYQKDLAPMVVADGMISAASGNDIDTKKQKRSYTIHWLNSNMAHFYPLLYKDIRNDPLLPAELRSQLSGPLKDLY